MLRPDWYFVGGDMIKNLHKALMILAMAMAAACSTQSSYAEPIDHKAAFEYFIQAKAASDVDGGRLWGTLLYGPMMFVDPQSRDVVANRPDAEGKLAQQGDVWTGKLSAGETMANTAKLWAGTEWTMILWPGRGGDKISRTRLMMHELYHRIQDDLKLPAANPSNGHLDTRDGRVWLLLEWRALAAALKAEIEQQKSAIEDAILFRSHRRSLFPSAGAEENALEINEGLAEYTGVKLCGQTDINQRSHAARLCEGHSRMHPSLTRSFAYTSGPAYGLLLDAYAPNWRKSLKADSDLGAMLAAACGAKSPGAATAQDRANQYDGPKIMADEDLRLATRSKLLADYKSRFVEGPTLTIPLSGNVNYSYDPNTVQAVEGLGLVYPILSVTDDWGTLEVTNGAVMVREKETPVRLIVRAPTVFKDQTLESDDWKLTVKPGWKLNPGERPGDFRVERAK